MVCACRSARLAHLARAGVMGEGGCQAGLPCSCRCDGGGGGGVPGGPTLLVQVVLNASQQFRLRPLHLQPQLGKLALQLRNLWREGREGREGEREGGRGGRERGREGGREGGGGGRGGGRGGRERGGREGEAGREREN